MMTTIATTTTCNVWWSVLLLLLLSSQRIIYVVDAAAAAIVEETCISNAQYLPVGAKGLLGSTHYINTPDQIRYTNKLRKQACGSALPWNSAGVWFYTVGTGNYLTASTCHPVTTLETQISIFTQPTKSTAAITATPLSLENCNEATFQCVTGNNDDSCDVGSLLQWQSIDHQVYFILVHGQNMTSRGDFGISLTENNPTNQQCQSSHLLTTDITTYGHILLNNNNNAGNVAPAVVMDYSSCPFSSSYLSVINNNNQNNRNDQNGAWFHVYGTGSELQVSITNCNSNFDSQVFILTGNCNDNKSLFSCVTTSPNDFCSEKSNGVKWPTKRDVLYYIFVPHGGTESLYSDEFGTFSLRIEQEDDEDAIFSNMLEEDMEREEQFLENVDEDAEAVEEEIFQEMEYESEMDMLESGTTYDHCESAHDVRPSLPIVTTLAAAANNNNNDNTDIANNNNIDEQYVHEYECGEASATLTVANNVNDQTALENHQHSIFALPQGSWFRVMGTGDTMSARTFHMTNSLQSDTQISVFTGTCKEDDDNNTNSSSSSHVLTCMNGNDNYFQYQSMVSWRSKLDTPYYILVHYGPNQAYTGVDVLFTLLIYNNFVTLDDDETEPPTTFAPTPLPTSLSPTEPLPTTPLPTTLPPTTLPPTTTTTTVITQQQQQQSSSPPPTAPDNAGYFDTEMDGGSLILDQITHGSLENDNNNNNSQVIWISIIVVVLVLGIIVVSIILLRRNKEVKEQQHRFLASEQQPKEDNKFMDVEDTHSIPSVL